MWAYLLYLFKKFVHYNLRSYLKKSRRRLKNTFLKKDTPKTSLADIKVLLLSDFGIEKGDSLIISSSFGNLNASYTPKNLILLLQEIVGPEGNIVMPFYPPGDSIEWAKSGKVFDMRTTPSSMGVVTQVLSEMPDVYKSKHPTKAVVAWGQNAQEIVAGHENSTTPFYWDSPYGWLLKNPSKSLGLGCLNIPIFHAIEDVLLKKEKWIYFNHKHSLKLKDYDGTVKNLKVYIHDPDKTLHLTGGGDYIIALNPPSYLRIKFGYSVCYIVNIQRLHEAGIHAFNTGRFRCET